MVEFEIEKCDNCRFSINKSKGFQYIECRRYPPVFTVDEYEQPLVEPKDWCGEFQSIPDDL